MVELNTAFTVEQLKETHELYTENLLEWNRYEAAFEGIKAIIDAGYIKKHEREPNESYERRIEELYGFGYSSSVVRILNFFLFKKPPQRTMQGLDDEEQWRMFWEDCNLRGDDWDTIMMTQIMLYASIMGHVGVLVDKSPISYANVQQEKLNRVYPYIAVYYPKAILDWKWELDKNNRPYLAYLKLLDEDGRFRLWTITEWAIYEIEEGKDKDQDKAKLVQKGVNNLQFIPFTWHYNMKSKNPGIGISDLNEIARIDISIIKNASQLEEVINYAAFPMMTKPRRDAKPGDVSYQEQNDEVSVKAIQEFDPEYPDARPEWMKPEVMEAIKGILDTVGVKVSEIYRAANVGGLASTEVQTQAKSGVALKTEFQMLNSELVSKAVNLEKTENKIVEFWLKWQAMWDKYGTEVHMGRSRNYDIENLAADLENALTARTIVLSKTFNALLQKQTARQVLPTAQEDDLTSIDDEIDDSVELISDEINLNEETEEDTEIINQVNEDE